MNKAFTLIELMVVISIIAIICAIAIPNLMEANNNHNKTPQGISIGYRDLVGKTFIWNGLQTTVVDYNDDWKYVLVLSKEGNSPVSVVADRELIMREYLSYMNKTQVLEKE